MAWEAAPGAIIVTGVFCLIGAGIPAVNYLTNNKNRRFYSEVNKRLEARDLFIKSNDGIHQAKIVALKPLTPIDVKPTDAKRVIDDSHGIFKTNSS